jgi:hypothetical protein
MTWLLRVFLLLVVLLAGCSSARKGGASSAPTREDELREVATMLTLLGGSGKGYSKPADLAAFEAGCPLGYQAVRTGAIVIVPGASRPGEGDKGGTDAVVAYEKAVPTEGGLVLLHNGKVKSMTAAEFVAARR